VNSLNNVSENAQTHERKRCNKEIEIKDPSDSKSQDEMIPECQPVAGRGGDSIERFHEIPMPTWATLTSQPQTANDPNLESWSIIERHLRAYGWDLENIEIISDTCIIHKRTLEELDAICLEVFEVKLAELPAERHYDMVMELILKRVPPRQYRSISEDDLPF
jgi:hypothetical protein